MNIPKYEILKNEIIKMIEQNTIGENEIIPSERELCDKYSMSRITVRKAIDELVRDDYLYKIHGKGTYVKAEPAKQDLFSIISCTEDILKANMKPSRKVINYSVQYPTKAVSKKLEIDSNFEVFILDRVFYADDIALNRTITYLPYKYMKGIENIDFSKVSLYATLSEKYNIQITRAQRTLEAVLAVDDIAESLNVSDGTPIILFRAVTYAIVNNREIPIECFKTYYRTDKIRFYINQIKGGK